MKHGRSGFTLIELVVVILVGSILVGVAMSSFQNAQSGYNVRGAKTMYATLHQLARARAIELGRSTFLIVDSDGDSAYTQEGGVVNNVTHFRRELNVDLRSTPSRFRICMTPRGYADTDCPGIPGFPATTSAPIILQFWQGADSATVIVLPMGQLVGL
jgi:prepilin-type N-terminal cleavage/methylation domain-containing protein